MEEGGEEEEEEDGYRGGVKATPTNSIVEAASSGLIPDKSGLSLVGDTNTL